MKNFLIVVDVQNGFINNETIETYNKISEIVTKYKNIDGSNIEKFMGWSNLKSEDSQRIMPKIYDYSDYIVVKHDYYSAYTNEMVEILKKENNQKLPENVFICGFDTECCVLKSAVDFFENGVRPLVLADYCFSTSGKKLHDAGLLVLTRLIADKNIIRNKIINNKEIEDYIKTL